MDSFYYFDDLMARIYILEVENGCYDVKSEISVAPETETKSWFARLSGWLSGLHRWFTEPIEVEAYHENRLPVPFRIY